MVMYDVSTGSFPVCISVYAILFLSRIDFQLRDWHDKLSPPVPYVRVLFHYLILEIPGEDEQIVRLGIPDLLGLKDGNMCARRVLSLFIRITIHSVDEKICSYATVIEQCVTLARCAVANDFFSIASGFNEEPKKTPLCCLHPFCEGRVGFQSVHPPHFLLFLKRNHPLRDRFGSVFCVSSVYSQRPAMRWDFQRMAG